mmetsp:Transcript_19159/g.38656  ORF Transcript_19159/g.38656 Transcript_19159/m.38656 type:complete len:120 (-) Transcript_19159:295-654(-)
MVLWSYFHKSCRTTIPSITIIVPIFLEGRLQPPPVCHDSGSLPFCVAFFIMERNKFTATGGENEDRLRDGPCTNHYIELETCANAKSLTTHKEKLVRCNRQTDELIKCMKKNPLFFQGN